jgi:hypothetical protein
MRAPMEDDKHGAIPPAVKNAIFMIIIYLI